MVKRVEQLESVVIRFAGDSGDGVQLTGSRCTSETALFGNDLATLPDFPAEIRAPAGSLPGVSGFQVHFADHDILTPGDQPEVLVVMNPAALKTNLGDLPKGGTLIADADAFSDRNVKRAGYPANPLQDGSLDGYQVHAVPLTSLTVGALKDIEGVTSREAERSKNMFALGLVSWLFGRPTEPTIALLETEAEIAGVGAALGASLGGGLGVWASAGPGVVLKSETVGLAVALELPLVIVDVQRAGPSTGMPTKPEQADLLLVLFGRNSESPVPVLAAATPGDCFGAAIEAARIALRYRTPVYLLSDAYLANGAEPWLIPDVGTIPRIAVDFAEPGDGEFLPY